MNRRSLFVASCIALIASAFTFTVRGDIMGDMGKSFGFDQETRGWVESAVFLGMAASMLVGAPLCDAIGMKKIMILAFFSHILGTFGTIFAPKIVPAGINASYWLFGVSFLMGCGNGLVETAVNPLVATMYSDRKTHMLNVLHAWWPGGLMIGGLLVSFLGNGLNLGPSLGLGHAFKIGEEERFGFEGLGYNWQWCLGLIVVPTLIYGLMLFGSPFPVTERVSAGVSTGAMFRELLRPGFIILAICMLMTAATELGPQKWQNSVMQRTANVSGTLVLVYTSGLMFVMRHFAGALAKAIAPTGMLLASSVLAGVGLYLLSFATNAQQAFGYATIFGIGIAYFWPTMLGVTAERFPRGGALTLCLIGAIGNIGIAVAQARMGAIYDRYAVEHIRTNAPELVEQVTKTNEGKVVLDDQKVDKLPAKSPEREAINKAEAYGAAWAFRWMSALPVILVVIFAGWLIVDMTRGGYKVERIQQH